MTAHCAALASKDSVWNFCPNVGAAYFFAIIFALLAIAHITQAIIYRKFYSVVIIASALLQVAAFVMRVISIQHPTSSGPYTGWFVVILVAPLWTNAYVYMIMGRMVYNFLPNRRLCKTQPWRFGLYFVLLDVVAFLIQAVGAVMASGTDTPKKQIMNGLHVYMVGIGFQEFFILVFVGVAVRFQLRLGREGTPEQQVRGLRMLYVLYAVLFLITVRVVFRLVEYSDGLDSSVPKHEAYMYVFDTAPMWIAILLFNIIHPGRYMPGKESQWPSRKERKRVARERRAHANLLRLGGLDQGSEIQVMEPGKVV